MKNKYCTCGNFLSVSEMHTHGTCEKCIHCGLYKRPDKWYNDNTIKGGNMKTKYYEIPIKKSGKHLVWCEHGFVVEHEVPENVTALPTYSCGHFHWGAEEIKTMDEVIAKVESIRQPKWYKTFKIGKFHFSLVKYW